MTQSISLALLFSWFISAGVLAQGLTLDEAFHAARKRSENIGISIESINQAEETYNQAKGAILPTIKGTASYLIQQTPPGALSNFSPSDQPTVQLNADQPLFRGFREYAGLRLSRLQSDSARESERQAEVQLLEDVATSFFTILSYEKDEENIRLELKLYDDRVGELNKWLRIGRSRTSEVLTVQSSQAALRAQLAQSDQLLQAQREVFAFLTGLPSTTQLADQAPPSSVEPLEAYLSRVNMRPDVLQAQLNQRSAEEGITIAKGGHWPSIDLIGDYYPVRPGFLQNVTWDAEIQLTINIFEGGIIQSQVHQAQSKEIQSELGVSQTKRQAEQDIRTDYKNLKSDMVQLEALTDARDLAEKTFRAERTDYRHGLVTNLDVLTALTSFEDAQRSLDKQKYQEKLDFTKLLAASQKSEILGRK